MALLLATPLLLLWPCLDGSLPGSFASVATMEPWNQAPGAEAWDILSADGALQFYAWRELTLEGWRTGQLPLWNPYQFCGTPLLANSQSAPFYPLHVLLGIAHVPTGASILVLAWIHLAVAGLGARELAVRFGASRQGATLAGFFFGTSLFMAAWLPLASVATTVAWVPGAMAAAVALAQGKGGRWFVVLAGSTGMSFLGGHLQFAVYGLLGTAVVAVVSLAVSDAMGSGKGWALSSGVAAVLLGLMLAGVQVVPSLAFSKLSHRQSRASSEGWAAYAKSAVQPWEFAGLAFPSLLGVPAQAEPDSGDAKISKYWPLLVKPGAHLAESAVAVALPALMLLGLVRWKRDAKKLAPLLALAGVGLLLALGPLSQLLYFGLPGWSATGSPGRASYLFVLALSVLGGVAWPTPEEKSEPKWALVALGVVTLTSLLVASANQSLTPWIKDAPVAVLASRRLVDALPSVGVAVGLAAAALFVVHRNRGAALGLVLASHTVAVLLAPVPAGRVPFQTPAPDPFKRYAFVNTGWDLLRTPRALMPPDTATAQRMLDVGGYDSLIDRASVEMLREVNGADPAPPANGNIMHVRPGFDAGKLADAGVSEVWSQRALHQSGLEPLSQEGGLFKYRLGGSRFDYPGGKVLKVEDRLDGLAVEVEGSGVLTVKDHMMEGWGCQVDRRATALPVGRWRTVETGGQGRHRLEFRYRPTGFGLGVGLSAFAFVGLVFLVGARQAMRALAARDEREAIEPG